MPVEVVGVLMKCARWAGRWSGRVRNEGGAACWEVGEAKWKIHFYFCVFFSFKDKKENKKVSKVFARFNRTGGSWSGDCALACCAQNLLLGTHGHDMLNNFSVATSKQQIHAKSLGCCSPLQQLVSLIVLLQQLTAPQEPFYVVVGLVFLLFLLCALRTK